MQLPLQVSLHGIASSDALQNAIREKAEKLERYYDHIVSCRVVLSLEDLHKRHGRQFTARIDLKVPGSEIAGETAQIVTFFVPDQEGLSAAWYACWVGTESGQVHRVAMISRAHYMVTDYRDFDGPIAIEPPVTDPATPPA